MGAMKEDRIVEVKLVKKLPEVTEGLSSLALEIANLGSFLRHNPFLKPVEFAASKKTVRDCIYKLEKIDEDMGSDSADNGAVQSGKGIRING